MTIDSSDSGKPVAVPRARPERARRPFLWLRRIILVVGLLSTVILLITLAAYNFGRGSETDEGQSTEFAPGDDGTVSRSKGVDYVQTSGGEKVFRVRADRSSQDRNDNAYLEKVLFDFYKDDAVAYSISSSTATLNQRSLAALLEGEVVVTGLGDLKLETRKLRLGQDGMVLESEGPVEFSYPPNLEGRASRLRIDRRTGEIDLDEGVHVRTVASAPYSLKLDCLKLSYVRGEGMIRAAEQVLLRFDNSELKTSLLTIFVDEATRTPRILRARWAVEARLESLSAAGSAMVASLAGDFLEIEPKTPESPMIFRLEGTVETPAAVRLQDDEGLTRAVEGARIRGESNNEQSLSRLVGEGQPLRLDEYLDLPGEPYYLRRVCAGGLDANIGSGGLLTLATLERNVDLQDRLFQVSGANRAILDQGKGSLNLEGSPVTIQTAKGDLSAPVVRYSQQTQIMRATGGVEASLLDSMNQLGSTALFGGKEGMPVRISAQESVWGIQESDISFKGGVRAWQGDNILTSEQLRAEDRTGSLSASGGVHAVWNQIRPESPEPQPIKLEAEMMTYRRDSSTVEFQNRVSVVDSGHTIRCQNLQAMMEGARSEAKQMTCTGAVSIVDAATRQQATGDRAVYDGPRQRVEIWGNPVTLIDGQQNQLVGKYLDYDLQSGRAKLQSKSPS